MNVDGSFVGSVNLERAGIGFHSSMSVSAVFWPGVFWKLLKMGGEVYFKGVCRDKSKGRNMFGRRIWSNFDYRVSFYETGRTEISITWSNNIQFICIYIYMYVYFHDRLRFKLPSDLHKSWENSGDDNTPKTRQIRGAELIPNVLDPKALSRQEPSQYLSFQCGSEFKRGEQQLSII